MRLFLFIITLSFTSFIEARPISITGVAATVNGKVVTLKEVRSLLAPTVNLLKTKYPRGGQIAEREFQNEQSKVLEQLIENKIILSELEKKGAGVPDYVVDNEIKRIINEFFEGSEAQFRQSLVESGSTMRSFRKNQNEKILVQALKAEQFGSSYIAPTTEEIEDHYNKSKLEFRDRTKDQIAFSKIYIPRLTDDPTLAASDMKAMAEQVVIDLQTGGDFSSIAKKVSKDAYAEEGGRWPLTSREDLDPSFVELLFEAETGSIIGPLSSPAGFTIVRVNQKQFGSIPSLKSIEERLIKEIKAEKYEKKYGKWINTLKSKAIIDRRLK